MLNGLRRKRRMWISIERLSIMCMEFHGYGYGPA
jgi:hypothetical protein